MKRNQKMDKYEKGITENDKGTLSKRTNQKRNETEQGQF